MGYQIRDGWGNVIGEMETDQERENRLGCMSQIIMYILAAVVVVVTFIKEYWYIILPIVVLIALIWIAVKKNKEEEEELELEQQKLQNQYSLDNLGEQTSEPSSGVVSSISSLPVRSKSSFDSKYENIRFATTQIGCVVEEYDTHRVTMDSIEAGNKSTIIKSNVKLKVAHNTKVFCAGYYIVDEQTQEKYREIENTLGTPMKPRMLKTTRLVTFKQAFPVIPKKVKKISIWLDNKCVVENLELNR